MKIKFSPQISDNKIQYSFDSEKITAVYNGLSESFDLSMLDGAFIQLITDEQLLTQMQYFKTNEILPFMPIINANRIDGILCVELINFISLDASEEEKYPDWIIIN